jgi:hypothetical protein
MLPLVIWEAGQNRPLGWVGIHIVNFPHHDERTPVAISLTSAGLPLVRQ